MALPEMSNEAAVRAYIQTLVPAGSMSITYASPAEFVNLVQEDQIAERLIDETPTPPEPHQPKVILMNPVILSQMTNGECNK